MALLKIKSTAVALDFRTRHLSIADKKALVTAVKRRPGKAYDVILEDAGGTNEHLHVEYDPDSL